MGRPKREPIVCECGYTTCRLSNYNAHIESCKYISSSYKQKQDDTESHAIVERELRGRIESLEQQLVAKDMYHKEQLAAKDKQIEQLIKRPRTTTNTTNISYTVNNINSFGHETVDDIPDLAIRLQRLLRDPDNSVANMIKLKQTVEQNRNIRVLNKREPYIQIVVKNENGKKEWKTCSKDELLPELVQTTAMELEGHADETECGRKYTAWYEKLMESQDTNGMLAKEQERSAYQALVDATRV